MNEKTLSTSPKQLVHEVPSSVFGSLTKASYKIFSFFLKEAVKYPTLYHTQDTIADAVGYRCRETVNRGIKKLVEAGLLVVDYRPNKSCIYTLNPILFTVVSWHNELWHWFKQYPPFIRQALKTIPLALSLLFSTGGYAREKSHTISYKDPLIYLSNKRHTAVEYPTGQAGVATQMPLVTKKESNNMEQVDYTKTKKVRGIALALNKRGAKLSNHDALGIMAYDDAVLDAAIAKIKESHGIRNPAAFFLGVCKKSTAEYGLLPDWDMVRYLRDNTVRLLSPEEETAALQVAVTMDAPRRTQKRGGDGVPYTEQVKQGQAREREAAQKRAPAKLDRQTEIDQARKDLATLEAKKEAGCPFSAMSAPIVRKILADLEATPVNHPLEPEAIRPATAEGAAVLSTWSQLGEKRFATQPKHYNGYIFDRDDND